VASHYIRNSGILDEIYATEGISGKNLALLIFGMWGKPIINCFVLITGYYMCTSTIRISKLIKLILEVLFYNLLIYLLFVLTGYTEFSFSGFFTDLLPVKSVYTNFISCYILFYLFIPYINKLIRAMEEKHHLGLLILLGGIYVILGTLPKITVAMNYVSWFTFVYLLASYFRLYKEKWIFNRRLWGILFIATYVMSVASIGVGLYASSHFGMRLIYYFLEDSNKILSILLATSFFFLFLNVRVRYSRCINRIAKTTFGVLLIHANSNLMRQWLWQDTLRCTEFYNTPYYLPHAVLSVMAVYIACVVIDLIRQKITEYPFYKLASKIESCKCMKQ